MVRRQMHRPVAPDSPGLEVTTRPVGSPGARGTRQGAGGRGGVRLDLLALLGLAILVVLKFWPFLRPTDREYRSTDLVLGIEGFFYDLLKRGVVYLWDPTVITGGLTIGGGVHHPQYAQGHFHLFYPLSVLVFGAFESRQYVPHIVLVSYQVFHYFLAGAFTYLYGRALRLGPLGSFVAALTYTFSTYMLAHEEHWLLVATAAWLPLIAYCLKRAIEEGSWGWGATAGIPLAMSFMAGHPQLFFYVLFATVLYWGFLCWQAAAQARRDGRSALPPLARRVGVFALSGAFALALASLQLIPTFGLGLESHQVDLPFDWKAQYSLSPAFLLHFVLPSAMEILPSWLAIASEIQLYVGILPLILAGLGLVTGGATAVFYAGLGFLALLLAFGGEFPLFRLFYDLVPGFNAWRVPSRILVLVAFALAVLAGHGAALVGGPTRGRTRRVLARTARVVTRLGIAITAIGFALGLATLAATIDPELSARLTIVLKDYALLVLFALLSATVLAVRLARGPTRAVQGLAIGVIALDLVVGGFSIGGNTHDPDQRLRANQDIVAFLERDPSLFRLGMRDSALIHALHLYRHLWPVYDEGSRVAPPRVLDLYFRVAKNPRLLDLLNVKYVLGPAPEEPPTKYGSLDLSPTLSPKTVPLELDRPVSALRLISHVAHGREIPQGTTLATLSLASAQGTLTFPIRAGIETAEWAHDHPWLPPPPHARPPIAESWPVEGEGYQGHYYRAVWRFDPPVRPTALTLRYTHGTGELLIKHLYADETDLATLPTRFRPVYRLIFENRYVLPRAFLVPRARVLPPQQVLAELDRFDPEREVLLSEVPPRIRGELNGPPLAPTERVDIVEYRFDRIRLVANVAHPRILVLSETWNRWWRAWDNGTEVPILRADHALRGLWLTPGRHELELRFRYSPFAVGLILTGLGWLVLVGWGLRTLLTRRRSTTP